MQTQDMDLIWKIERKILKRTDFVKKILAFGELLWDVLPDKMILGGAPFNFAYRVNSLGDLGLFAGSVGVDELGDKAVEQARALGVDTYLLQRNSEFQTGVVDVSFDENHMPDYVIKTDVAFDHIKTTDALLKAVSEIECLYFGSLIQRAGVSRQTLYTLITAAANAVKFLDINLRKLCYSKESILYSLHRANILKVNDDEVLQLREILGLPFKSFPGFCRTTINEFDLDYVLVTFGEFGALSQSAYGEQVYVPGHKIKLADSLGAGDAFSAAFIHHILNGRSLQTACEKGNALGAMVAKTHGATAPISDEQISNLLLSTAERNVHPEFY